MTIDRKLQEQVLAALEYEPAVSAAQIGVSVTEGVVTLQGVVPTFTQKWLAEKAARHLHGVRAVANDLEVAPTGPALRTDSAIAQATADALEWDSGVPDGSVKATVRNGWVTLNGTVPWQFQRAAAERAVTRLYGVRGVSNSILVRPQVSVTDVQSKIEEALKRSALIDARGIKVDARDGTIVLTGTVHSLTERDAAEKAAWAAPGVVKVEDHIGVVP